MTLQAQCPPNCALWVSSEIKLPDFDKLDPLLSEQPAFFGVLGSHSSLTRMLGTVGVLSWVGMPKSTVDLNSRSGFRKVKIHDGCKASVRVTESVLRATMYAEIRKHFTNFLLQFGNTREASLGYGFRDRKRQFLLRSFGMSVAALSFAFRVSLFQSLRLTATCFGRNRVRRSDDAMDKAERPRFVVARSGTQNRVGLLMRRRSSDRGSANTTRFRFAGVQFLSPQGIRAFPRASCFSPVFQPHGVGFVAFRTDGALSLHLGVM